MKADHDLETDSLFFDCNQERHSFISKIHTPEFKTDLTLTPFSLESPVENSSILHPRPSKTIQKIYFPDLKSSTVIHANSLQIKINILDHSIPSLTNPKPPKPPEPKKTCCNCKKSKCLKLYCDCFAAGVFCDQCTCVNCFNTQGFKAINEKAKKNILGKNPNAFVPKFVEVDNKIDSHIKGCNCKKTGCTKNYCECYQGKIKCTDLCKCIDCCNRKPDQKEHKH